MNREGTESWLRAQFQRWLGELGDDQLAALAENWENVMNDAASDRVDAWIVAKKTIDALREGQGEQQ